MNSAEGRRDSHVLIGNSEGQVRFPALTVLAYDARVGLVAGDAPDRNDVGELNGVFYGDLEERINRMPPGAARHSNGANYGFADGHVKWSSPKSLLIKRRSDGIHPGFGL